MKRRMNPLKAMSLTMNFAVSHLTTHLVILSKEKENLTMRSRKLKRLTTL